jgi:acyl carrier protein
MAKMIVMAIVKIVKIQKNRRKDGEPVKYNWDEMNEQQKLKAFKEEAELVTHNGTTKQDLVNILKFVWHNCEIESSEIGEETYNPDTHDKVIKIIAEQLSCDREEISIDDKVGTLEIDSLDLVEIKMAIDSEFEFNYNYELDYFNNNMTVGEIIEIVEQKIKSK